MISNTPDTFFSRRMKLLSILVLPIWAVGATAQGITIGSPEQGKNVFPGQQLTIQVIKNVRGLDTFSQKPLILTSAPDPGLQ